MSEYQLLQIDTVLYLRHLQQVCVVEIFSDNYRRL